MSWKLVNAKDEYHKHAEDWDKLNESLNYSHPMLDSRFVSALVHFFASGKIILAIYKSNGVCMNMALLEKNKFQQWKTFLPSQTQIASSLISNSETFDELFQSLGWNTLYIDFLCQDPYYTFNLKNKNMVRYWHATTINIEIAGDFNNYWIQRSKNLRKNLKRYLNKLKNDCLEIKLDIIDQKENIKNALGRYAEIESAGWKKEVGTAIHPNNMQGEFYKSVLCNFSYWRNCRIYELYFGNKLVASRITIFNNDMLIILKTTYSEDEKKYAPGRVLLYKMLEHEFDQKDYKFIEFYTNATSEQKAWCTDSRDIEHVRVYRNKYIKNGMEIIKTVKNKLNN